MATKKANKPLKKKTAPPRKASNKKVSKNPTKKPAKKIVSSRPAATKPARKPTSNKKVIDLKKVSAKKVVKTKQAVKPKKKVVAKKKVVMKPDTTLSCHRCGKTDRFNFEFVWTNGWPVCCREGMHIEDSDIKIGEVMNKAWIDAGGYGGSLNLNI